MDLFQSDRKRQRISLEEGKWGNKHLDIILLFLFCRGGEWCGKSNGLQQRYGAVPSDGGRGGGGLRARGGRLQGGQLRGGGQWQQPRGRGRGRGRQHHCAQQRPGAGGPMTSADQPWPAPCCRPCWRAPSTASSMWSETRVMCWAAWAREPSRPGANITHWFIEISGPGVESEGEENWGVASSNQHVPKMKCFVFSYWKNHQPVLEPDPSPWTPWRPAARRTSWARGAPHTTRWSAGTWLVDFILCVIILTSYWLRRRRDNINNWIMKLSKLLPECGGANTIPGPGDLHSPGGAAKVSCHWWRGTALDPDWSRRRSPRAGSWRRRASTWRRCGTRTSGWWTASSRPRRSRRTTSVFHHKLNSYR